MEVLKTNNQLQNGKLRNGRLLFSFNVALSLLNLPNSNSVAHQVSDFSLVHACCKPEKMTVTMYMK